MEKVIRTVTGGYSVRYNDEGILCIQDNGSNKNMEVFFPYGCITKLKLGFLGLDIVGGGQKFYMPVGNLQVKTEVQEMIAYAQNQKRSAPPMMPQAPVQAVAVNHAVPQQTVDRYAAERAFYEACQKAGVKLNESSPAFDIARAIQAARQIKLFIREQDAVMAYSLGKQDTKRVRRQQKFKELYDRSKELDKYLTYTGRDMEVFVTGEMLNYYKQQQENIYSGKELTLREETDWAIMGGIASAIAGTAAGVAVASDIQARNAEVRQQNAQLRTAYARAAIPRLEMLKGEIEKWTKIHEKAKNATLADRTQDELFKQITITEEKVHVLDDGNFVVTAQASIRDLMLHSKLQTRVDGSLTALVYQDGVLVGDAPIVLPRRGDNADTEWSNGRKCTVIGSSQRRCADPAKPCTVQFVPRNLWAIEKIKMN